MKAFKDTFKEARKSLGLQQKQLAEQLDVVPAYISRLEKGFSLPSNDLIIRACELLGLDIQEVYLQVAYEKTDNPEIRHIIESLYSGLRSTGLSGDEKLIAEKYGKLDGSQKKVINNLIDSLTAQ